MNSKAELADVVADRAFSSGYRRSTLFRFSSNQDAKDSAQEIAETDQGGLGLPRPRLLPEDDAKSVELRLAYGATCRTCSSCLATSRDAPPQRRRCFGIETASGAGSMTASSVATRRSFTTR